MVGSPILKTEVEKAIKFMKRGKSGGPGNVRVEIFEALDEWGMEQMPEFLNTIHETRVTPKDLRISIFITLPKKPGKT